MPKGFFAKKDTGKIQAKGPPLILATQKGDLDAVIRLAREGADVNEKDDLGSTALHHAACNRPRIAEFLLSSGAETECKDSYGLTPLHVAFYRHDRDTFELLTSHGADIHNPFPDGRTPAQLLKEQPDWFQDRLQKPLESRSLGKKPSRLPDIGMSLFFGVVAVAALCNTRVADVVAEDLAIWFVYEYYGVFFLLFWLALNEHRPPSRRPDLYRVLSACSAYVGFGALLFFVFRLPFSMVLVSAIGGVWALLAPLTREDAPTVFQMGREMAIGLLSLVASFIPVMLVSSIAEQVLPRTFHRATLEAVTIASVGAVYYALRCFAVARFAPRESHKTAP